MSIVFSLLYNLEFYLSFMTDLKETAGPFVSRYA